MGALAQNNSEVPQGAVSDKISNLQQVHVIQIRHSTSRLQYSFSKYMYFDSDIQLVKCNIKSTSTCISIWTFDQSNAILIQQVHVFRFGHLTAILIQQVHVFQFGHLTSRLQY